MELWNLAIEPFQSLTDNSVLQDLINIFNDIWINPQGWRCAMVKCAHLSIINKLTDQNPEIASQIFGPSAYWLLIRRKDVFARAVSLAHALTTGRFHEYSSDGGKNPEYVVSNDKIYSCLEMISLADTFLSGCIPRFTNLREFHYEEILVDERGFLNGVGEFAFGQSLVGDDDELVHPKLRPVHTAEKARQREEFISWFIRAYH